MYVRVTGNMILWWKRPKHIHYETTQLYFVRQSPIRIKHARIILLCKKDASQSRQDNKGTAVLGGVCQADFAGSAAVGRLFRVLQKDRPYEDLKQWLENNYTSQLDLGSSSNYCHNKPSLKP
jgi:hypothetical protein